MPVINNVFSNLDDRFQRRSEDVVVALFNLYHVRLDARPARGARSSKPTADRLELAAAILCFKLHANDPGPVLDSLPF